MNNYHLYEELHKSKNCSVYKARRRGSIQYVAVKCVDKSRRSRLLAEVSSLNELKGIKGVTQFLCWYETRNHLWLAIEYCPGGDLLRAIQQDSVFPETSIRTLGAEICTALYQIHLRGLSHNSITAANVFFCEDGSIRLGDFGSSGRLTDDGSADLNQLGILLQSLRMTDLSAEFSSLLRLLKEGPIWYRVISHEFWEGILKVDFSPLGLATTPQGPTLLQPQQDLEVSVLGQHVTEKVDRSRADFTLSSAEALSRSRTLAALQVAGLVGSPQPISEDVSVSETSRESFEEFVPQALLILRSDSPQAAFPALARFSSNHSDAILRSEICPALMHLLNSPRGPVVAQLLGCLLRHSNSLEPPLWCLPAALAAAVRGPAAGRAIAALGEFIFYAATAKNQDWAEARGAAAEIRVALAEGEGVAFTAAVQTVENVSLVAHSFARRAFFSAEVLGSLCRKIWQVPASLRPQVFSAIWFLSRVDPDKAQTFPYFLDLEFSARAVAELGRTRCGSLVVAFLRWQLQTVEISSELAGSLCPLLAALAPDRSGAGALLCLCELLRTSGEAVAAASAGGALEGRSRKDKNFEDSLVSLTTCFASEVRENRLYPQLLSSPVLSSALLNSENLQRVLSVRSPRMMAAVAERLPGCAGLAKVWRETATSFLPALLDALPHADDVCVRDKLFRGFCELSLSFLVLDESGLIVQNISEKLAPLVNLQLLAAMQDPMPSLFLRLVLAASAASRHVLNRFPAGALVDFCLLRPSSPHAWEVLAVLASAKLFEPLESPAALSAVNSCISVAQAGEREEATAEAAAQLLSDALSAASPAVVAQRTATLARLVGPCALASGFRWAAELLAALAFALPAGTLSLTGGDASAVASALARSGGDWARAAALVEVCGRVGASSDSKTLSRGLADFLLKYREEAPAATVTAARKLFKILN